MMRSTRHQDAAKAFPQSAGSNAIGLCGWWQCAGDHHIAGLAAAPFQDQPGRQFQPGQHELRIDAALEAVARVGNDALLAARARDARTGSK